jgi:hypothetical protein
MSIVILARVPVTRTIEAVQIRSASIAVGTKYACMQSVIMRRLNCGNVPKSRKQKNGRGFRTPQQRMEAQKAPSQKSAFKRSSQFNSFISNHEVYAKQVPFGSHGCDDDDGNAYAGGGGWNGGRCRGARLTVSPVSIRSSLATLFRRILY